jgi:hypothetical protein
MATNEKRISVFFYGSFIRPEVMNKSDLRPEGIQVARLSGFDIYFSPHARLKKSSEHSIYGVLLKATHRELDKMYSAPGVGTFLPEAVVVETKDGSLIPALCYISPSNEKENPDNEYIDALIGAAIGYEFPQWYIDHLGDLRQPN